MKDCKDCVFCMRYTENSAQCILFDAWWMKRTDAEECIDYEEERKVNKNE